MKKSILKLSLCIVICTCIVIFLNINVTSRQGINYQVHIIRMPLYLKILDFFDRHFNYKQLVKEIIKESAADKEQVMKIFTWTCNNIKKAPEGLPIMDDHVWYTIVRGYGVGDQFQDVFTTLCNYAGLDAFFSYVYTQDRAKRISLSFVEIEDKWCIFDPYRGVYFKDTKGELADIETISSKNIWLIESKGKEPGIDYAIYLDNLSSIKERKLSRANIQSPLRRIMFEIRKWLNLN